MQHNEITELQYLIPPNTPQFPPPFHLNNHQCITTDPLHNFQNYPQIQSSFSSNNSSTSEEADELNDEMGLIFNERKQRRMISNRESARRSRMRKQKQLDELCSQLHLLRTENLQLIDKLNIFSERHEEALQENAQLRDEVKELRQMITDLKI
ncbi:hypothetical protein Leryth_014936 [Lithospermum erythrorhizon]|nr:hypothetical protein Leryth_014936 [Lithospermum erythrorhizon]